MLPYSWLTDDDWHDRFLRFIAAYEAAVERGAMPPMLSRDMIEVGDALRDGLAAGLAGDDEQEADHA